jgi:hypothetical protein
LRVVKLTVRQKVTSTQSALLILCVLGATRRANGQCVRSEGRPVEDLIRSDVVYPQERGEMQIELLPAFESSGNVHSWALAVATQYGVTNAVQLEASWAGPVSSAEPGKARTWDVGNLTVGSKLVFMCMGRTAFHSSVSLDVEMPTGTEEGDRRPRIQPTMIFARDLRALHAHVFTSAQLSIPVGRVTSADSLVSPPSSAEIAGTDLQWDAGGFIRFKTLRVTGEVTLLHQAGERAALQLTPGLIWHSEPWEVAVGAFTTVDGPPARGALFHVVYAFGGHDNR